MENNDLKSMWHDAHINQENIYDKGNIEKFISVNHCKTIGKVLSDVKLKILGYATVLMILIGLMIYSLGFLGLSLQTNSRFLFSFIGFFFLIRTTSQINRLLVLKRIADNISVKESLLLFSKQLNKIRTIDFISYLIYFYTLATWVIYSCMNDIKGIKTLFPGNAMFSLIMIVILMLLLIPWFIKYQHNQRYKKLYSNLNDSSEVFNE